MERILNFYKSLTFKGGEMYKKVLAFLLVCLFGLSSVCGAMTMSSFSSVDNLALKDFLDGKSGDAAMQANFLNMLNLLTKAKYTANDKAIQDINKLWGNSVDIKKKIDALKAVDVDIAANGDIKVGGKIVGNIDENAIEQDLDNLITKEGRDILSKNIAPDSATIGRNLNADGTQNDAALLAMANDLHTTGRSLTADEAVKIANWINIWEANVAKATLSPAERAAEEAAIADARAKLANRRFFVGKAQVESDDRYVLEAHEGIGDVNGRITIAEEWLQAPDAVGADMTSHAFRVENGQAGHEASLAQNAVQERVSSRATMAKTAAKANEIIDTGLAKIAAAQNAVDEVATTVNKEKLSEGGQAAKDEAARVKAELVKKPEFAQLTQADDEQFLDVLNSTVKGAVDGYLQQAQALQLDVAKMAAAEIDNTVLDTKVNQMQDGQKLAFYMGTLVTRYKGSWAETFPGLDIFNRMNEIASMPGSKLKEGVFNIIGTGADRDAIKAFIAKKYPDLVNKGIVQFYSRTERDLVNEGIFLTESKGSTTVVFHDEVTVGVTGVDYVPVVDVARTNGLKLLSQVLAPRGEKISGAEQQILAEIFDGTLKTPNLTVANDSDYKIMFDKYLEAIELYAKA